jgi:23S rRNA pseudouridine2605 synthase
VCDDLVGQGRVTVNGEQAVPGRRVDAEIDVIAVDGVRVSARDDLVYYLLNKPAGYVSTASDPEGRSTVVELVPGEPRVFPVGRLDYETEGLLVLTNDGDWAERVLHPRFGVQREYAIGLRAPLDGEQESALRRGIPLEEGQATLVGPLRRATRAETETLIGLLDPPADDELVWYRAILAQGWKRQLRRMFGSLGAPIERLVRVRIGSVRLDGIRSGRARALRDREVSGIADNSAAPRPRGKRRPSPKDRRR